MCGKKIFVCFIFVVPGFRQKFFHTEFFPNYGISLGSLAIIASHKQQVWVASVRAYTNNT